ncbi:hypothetical protein ACJZ2D_004546 [Fusarium nematophilum]
MCRITSTPLDNALSSDAAHAPYLECSRLNPSTFLVIEHDRWGENPFIYVKIYPSSLVLIDTGCGGKANNPAVSTTLRDFLENGPVSEYDNKPLNPNGGKAYTIIVSHCHYDHIGGLAEFTRESSTTIWASALDKEFMYSPNRFADASLCSYVGMELPPCEITHWAFDGQRVADYQGNTLGLSIYQTPGHTPDELAVWDPSERYLFVGDTAYERAPILFPLEGNIVDYAQTLEKLKCLVGIWNDGVVPDGEGGAIIGPEVSDTRPDGESPRRVKMACGHITSSVDAEDFVTRLSNFLNDIKRGKAVAITNGELTWVPSWLPGEEIEEYKQLDGQLSFLGPRRFFDLFKRS